MWDDDNGITSSMCLFLSSCIGNGEDQNCEPCLATFFISNKNFISSLCHKVQVASEKLGSDDTFPWSCTVLSQCADIVVGICHHKKIQTLLTTSSTNPVPHLARVLCTGRTFVSDKHTTALRGVRASVLRALLSLSATAAGRPAFYSSIVSSSGGDEVGSIISILVALAKTSESDTESSREMALMIVANLLTPIDDSAQHSKSVNAIVKEMQRYGFVDDLLKLCTSEDTPIIVKHRCIAVVDRLLCTKSVGLDEDAVNSLWREFIRAVTDEHWSNDSEDTLTDSLASIALHLVKIVGTGVKKVSWTHPKCAITLVNLLPTPQVGPKGPFTAESVCLPPRKGTAGSAYAKAASKPSFHANVLKIMISFLDACPDHVTSIVKEGGIERLVCILANSSRQHQTITNNAASALARLAKSGGPEVKQRCRDLRGMEILLALGQSGKI